LRTARRLLLEEVDLEEEPDWVAVAFESDDVDVLDSCEDDDEEDSLFELEVSFEPEADDEDEDLFSLLLFPLF